MQLRTARLCLDCEEVHDAMVCPSCASETFTYITRWIPAPERRHRPRATTSPEAEMFRSLVGKESEAEMFRSLVGKESPASAAPQPHPSGQGGRRMLKRGAIGLTALGLAGWFLRKKPGD
jgi:hypothetical protein